MRPIRAWWPLKEVAAMPSFGSFARHPVGDPHRPASSLRIALLALVVFSAPTQAQPLDTLALRLPPDAVFDSRVGRDSAVVFRHTTHVELASGRCTVCHPKPFRILSPTLRLTHGEMNARRSCGVCHDGEHAFDTMDPQACVLCHVGRAPAAATVRAATTARSGTPAYRGPKPITYRSGEVSPGTVTFRHATHTNGGCTNCHPRLFTMKTMPAGANTEPKGDMHAESACGACHDGKKSFAVDDERSCVRCHQGSAR
jgi:c(7)-type cytochrome triheme protein